MATQGFNNGKEQVKADDWPTDWKADSSILLAATVYSPSAIDVAPAYVYVPRINGKPDIGGLIARLGSDPAKVEEARAEVERLREVLLRYNVCGLLRDIAAFARQGDLGKFERLVCSAEWLEGLASEIDAALAERGGEHA